MKIAEILHEAIQRYDMGNFEQDWNDAKQSARTDDERRFYRDHNKLAVAQQLKADPYRGFVSAVMRVMQTQQQQTQQQPKKQTAPDTKNSQSPITPKSKTTTSKKEYHPKSSKTISTQTKLPTSKDGNGIINTIKKIKEPWDKGEDAYNRFNKWLGN